jgi:hypothetical protein
MLSPQMGLCPLTWGLDIGHLLQIVHLLGMIGTKHLYLSIFIRSQTVHV